MLQKVQRDRARTRIDRARTSLAPTVLRRSGSRGPSIVGAEGSPNPLALVVALELGHSTGDSIASVFRQQSLTMSGEASPTIAACGGTTRMGARVLPRFSYFILFLARLPGAVGGSAVVHRRGDPIDVNFSTAVSLSKGSARWAEHRSFAPLRMTDGGQDDRWWAG